MKERIIANESEAKQFIKEKVEEIKYIVKNDKAIGFVSGGVDSSVVAMLGHQALGRNLRTVFVYNGLMRRGETVWVIETFSDLGILVQIVPAADMFFSALAGKVNPFDKRVAIRDTFYYRILPEVANENGAKFLLQGTNLTDIEATAFNSRAPQHNVLEQVNIDIGLTLIEPLKKLRKPSIRLVGKTLGLPEAVFNRMPFLGPALAGRIVGEVTEKKVGIIRGVTQIVEECLSQTGAFQCMAILVSDSVPNHDRTKIGYAITIECIESVNATTAQPTPLSQELMYSIRDKIYQQLPEVFKIAWDISTKPPAAIEWQ